MSEITEWRQKSDDELRAALHDLRREGFNLRFQAANGVLENTSRVRRVRRDIARVKTLMSARAAAARREGE